MEYSTINQIVKIGRDDDMMIVLDSRGLGAVNIQLSPKDEICGN